MERVGSPSTNCGPGRSGPNRTHPSNDQTEVVEGKLLIAKLSCEAQLVIALP